MSAITSIARSRRLQLSLPRLDSIGLVTGIAYLLFFGYGFVTFTDPDYWWHFRTGQLIVHDLAIPRHDIYSFTIAGRSWIVDSWLSETLIYLSVSRLGYPFTLGLFSAASLASFGLMQRRLLRLGTPSVLALLLVVLGILMSVTYWTVRPQLLSFCLLAVFINALLDRDDPPWLLVPLIAVWANVHPGFAFGLITVTLWFAARLWDHRADGRAFVWRRAALFVAACGAASLLNPNGPLLLAHRISFVPFIGQAEDLKAISEWASPNFHDAMHLPLLAGILLLMALCLSGRVRDRFALLLALSFTALALSASRYQPMFAIAFLPAAGLAARNIRLPQLFGERPTRSLANWAILGVTALTIIAIVPLLPKAQIDRQARSDSWVYYPADALAWIQQYDPDANVFTNYSWGGYFINGLYPNGRVFLDGRSDTYGAFMIDEYSSISNAHYGWQEKLEGSGANAVVVSPKSRLAAALQATNGWQQVLETNREAVFIKR